MEKKRTVVIIQARMGASRLSGKVLMKIAERPMLEYAYRRSKAAKGVDDVVVATTTNKNDQPIVDFCREQKVSYFRGSEEDVLDRYFCCAKEFKADVIVRVTADCPLIDPAVIDEAISLFRKSGCDYVSNTLTRTYPDGLDVEVFSFKALKKASKEAFQLVDREHVTPYFKNQPSFSKMGFQYRKDLSHLRWTVDELTDLKVVDQIYRHVRGDLNVTMEKVLDITSHESDIYENRNINVNEGYYLSFKKEKPIPPKQLILDRSYMLKDRASRVIPSCTQTFSKGPTQFSQGVAPVFLESAKGCFVKDVDGNEYIDYASALGPIVLGYNDPVVHEAVRQQMESGVVFSLPHQLEIEVAELLTNVIPCAEMVRFGKNGSDVTAGAVRLARAYTGRDKIACCGYHGWQDWYIGTTSRRLGVPKAIQELTLPFVYNKIESLEKIFLENPNQIACVIMEVVGVEPPQKGFLKDVKLLAHKHDALLIFDEVITGFRFSLGGAQEYFDVIPDLACFGKALGNGYPISAIVGLSSVMKLLDEVFFSFTFGGECISLAAAKATIGQIQDLNVITHLWKQGQKLKDGYNKLAGAFDIGKYTECVGYYPRTLMKFQNEKQEEWYLLKSLFQQECLRRGLLFTGYQFITLAHTDQVIDDTLRIFRSVFEVVAGAIQNNLLDKYLEGNVVQPVFRRA